MPLVVLRRDARWAPLLLLPVLTRVPHSSNTFLTGARGADKPLERLPRRASRRRFRSSRLASIAELEVR